MYLSHSYIETVWRSFSLKDSLSQQRSILFVTYSKVYINYMD